MAEKYICMSVVSNTESIQMEKKNINPFFHFWLSDYDLFFSAAQEYDKYVAALFLSNFCFLFHLIILIMKFL